MCLCLLTEEIYWNSAKVIAQAVLLDYSDGYGLVPRFIATANILTLQ
jgi:hypothetical protein